MSVPRGTGILACVDLKMTLPERQRDLIRRLAIRLKLYNHLAGCRQTSRQLRVQLIQAGKLRLLARVRQHETRPAHLQSNRPRIPEARAVQQQEQPIGRSSKVDGLRNVPALHRIEYGHLFVSLRCVRLHPYYLRRRDAVPIAIR